MVTINHFVIEIVGLGEREKVYWAGLIANDRLRDQIIDVLRTWATAEYDYRPDGLEVVVTE